MDVCECYWVHPHQFNTNMRPLNQPNSHCTSIFGLVNHWHALLSMGSNSTWFFGQVNRWQAWIHIALRESMTSNNSLAPGLRTWWTYHQQRKSLGSNPTFLSRNPNLKKRSWLKSYQVGGTEKYQLNNTVAVMDGPRPNGLSLFRI